MPEVTYEVWPPLGCARLGNAKVPQVPDASLLEKDEKTYNSQKKQWDRYKKDWDRLANEGFYDCKHFFIGPETRNRNPPKTNKVSETCDVIDVKGPAGETVKKNNKIKKQVARFRIFKFVDGVAVEEVEASDKVQITWIVTAANSKANWYEYSNALDLTFKDQTEPGQENTPWAPIPAKIRNKSTVGELRSGLIITGNTELRTAAKQEDRIKCIRKLRGKFMNDSVCLSECRVDPKGRLLYFPGYGHSKTTLYNNPIINFSNNDFWYDDQSDACIEARVKISTDDGRTIEHDCKPGWVFSGPPDYAPEIEPITTLYDVLVDRAITFTNENTNDDDCKKREEWKKYLQLNSNRIGCNEKCNFYEDILPIFQRVLDMKWVSQVVNLDNLLPFDNLTPEIINELGNPKNNYDRKSIFDLFRPPYEMTGERESNNELIPRMLGDAVDYGTNNSQSFFAISPRQYEMLRQWSENQFDKGECTIKKKLSDYDIEQQPFELAKANLYPVSGGAFHPGVELTWPLRHVEMFCLPFRVNHADSNDLVPTVENQNWGQYLYPHVAKSIVRTPVRAGDLTRWMGLPWQSDGASCQSVYFSDIFPNPVWWPAILPVDVIPEILFSMVDGEKQVSIDRGQKLLDQRVSWVRGVGDVGYHAEGGYTNSIRYIVEQWNLMGFVKKQEVPDYLKDSVGESVYVEMERAIIPAHQIESMQNALALRKSKSKKAGLRRGPSFNSTQRQIISYRSLKRQKLKKSKN